MKIRMLNYTPSEYDKFQTMLNDMRKEGYVLVNIFLGFAFFRKSDKTDFKYVISFRKVLNDKYKDFLHEFNLEYLTSYNQLHIFTSDDFVNLYSDDYDEEELKSNLKKELKPRIFYLLTLILNMFIQIKFVSVDTFVEPSLMATLTIWSTLLIEETFNTYSYLSFIYRNKTPKLNVVKTINSFLLNISLIIILSQLVYSSQSMLAYAIIFVILMSIIFILYQLFNHPITGSEHAKITSVIIIFSILALNFSSISDSQFNYQTHFNNPQLDAGIKTEFVFDESRSSLLASIDNVGLQNKIEGTEYEGYTVYTSEFKPTSKIFLKYILKYHQIPEEPTANGYLITDYNNRVYYYHDEDITIIIDSDNQDNINRIINHFIQ